MNSNHHLDSEGQRAGTRRAQAGGSLARDHALVQALLHATADGVAVCDADGCLCILNDTLQEWTGQPPLPVPPEDWATHCYFTGADGVTPLPHKQMPLWLALHGEVVTGAEITLAPPGGPLRVVQVRAQPLRDGRGRRLGAVSVLRDITAGRDLAQRLAETEQHYKSLFDQNVDAVYSFSLDGRFLSANPACEGITGYRVDELIGTTFLPLVVPEDQARAAADFARAVQGEASFDEVAITHKDGRRMELNLTKVPILLGGQVVGVYGIAKDISRRKGLEREREQTLSEALDRAERDPLTGLLNHRAFHKRLQEETDRAQREGTPLAIAVIDMDNFKFFNDAYGHPVGDDVLRTVAGALSGVCRSYDTLARFGGDEFALLMPRVTAEEADALAARLSSCLDAIDYHPDGQIVPVPLTLSVGMAAFPADAIIPLDALAVADARLRDAKSGSAQTVASQARERLRQTVEGFALLDALVTAVDSKDRYTRRHTEEVLTYALEIAYALDVEEGLLGLVPAAALLHDVGKIGIPDALLRKPGPLSPEETQAIQRHAEMGAVIVGAVPGFDDMLDAVRFHHERWDGSGYPVGLRGENIPLLARLLAVADAFSAITSDHPYRKGLPVREALSLLEAGAGAQWDPVCVAAFVQSRAAFL